MSVSPDSDLLAYIASNGDSCEITVEGMSGHETRIEGLRAAAERIAAIPHPDEPSEGLPNWIDVEDRPDGPVLVFDIKDWGQAYASEIVRILVESLQQAGFVGVIRPVSSAAAGSGGGIPDDVLARFGSDHTPRAFPSSFPVPSGASAVGGTSTNARADVTWRLTAEGRPVMDELESTLPAAGYAVVCSAEAIGTPTYTGAIAFSGPAIGEVTVRVGRDATYVEATVYLGEPPENAFLRALDDPEVRRHLRFRIAPS